MDPLELPQQSTLQTQSNACASSRKVYLSTTINKFAYAHSRQKYGIVRRGTSKCTRKLFTLLKTAIRNIEGVMKTDSWFQPVFLIPKIPYSNFNIYTWMQHIRWKNNINKDNRSYWTRKNNWLEAINHQKLIFGSSPHYRCVKSYKNWFSQNNYP